MIDFNDLFRDRRVMGILRGLGVEASVALATAAWDAGIDVLEVPVQDPRYLPSLRAVAEAGRERGLPVGAGTIISLEQLNAVIDVGAAFTVAPGFDIDIAQTSVARGIAHLPGVATATELQSALRGGFSWVKAFPASVLGAEWLRAMRAPFPTVSFVATGGMDASNAHEFLDAGARVIAVGSAIGDAGALTRLADIDRGVL